MQDIILVKLGEIILKGLNRRSFEQKLMANMRRKIAPYGNFSVYCLQSTVYVEAKDEEADVGAALQACPTDVGLTGSVPTRMGHNAEHLLTMEAEERADKKQQDNSLHG